MIDPFEDLFSLPHVTADQRRDFVALLDGLARSGSVWVIAAMRSDFYPRLAELPVLRELVAGAGRYDLPLPRPAELGQMIRLPAEAAGLRFEAGAGTTPGLDAVLLEATSGDPAALPLLEFALDELYRHDVEGAGGSMLTFAGYRALGGLAGAIAGRAELVCRDFAVTAPDALAETLAALVTVAEDSDLATARTVARAEVATTPERAQLLEALIRGRLVVAGGDDDGATLRLVHEALLHHWPRLSTLIQRDREFLRVRGRLVTDRLRWQRDDRAPDLLLPPGKRLAEGEDALRRRRGDLDQETIDFVERSSRREQENRDRQLLQARRRLRQTRLFAAAMAALALAAGGAGWMAWQQKTVAEQQRQRAERTIALATETANGVVSELAQKFRHREGVRVDLVRDILAEARTLQNALALEQDLTIRKRLAEADPGNAQAQRHLAVSQERIGDVSMLERDWSAAAAAYRTEVTIVDRLLARSPGQPPFPYPLDYPLGKLTDCVDALAQQAVAANAAGQPAAAVAGAGQAVEIGRFLAGRDPQRRANLAGLLGNLSWYQLSARDFPAARAAAVEAFGLDDKQVWVLTNAAHAEMFLGQTEAALARHRRYRDAVVDGDRTWRQVVVEDFATFRKAGLDPPAMVEVERVLAEKP